MAAVLHHSPATGTAKVVLLAIAWHTNDNPELGCYPSQETLAKYANTSSRTVRRALNDLEQMGEIEIDRHGGVAAGSSPSNRYFIRTNCPSWCDSTLWHRDLSTGRLVLQDILDRNTGHS
jgi:DNA-binding FadR family transcriptional regulator